MRSLLFIMVCTLFTACERTPSDRPKHLPTFNSKSRVIAMNFPTKGMTSIQYIAGHNLQPTGIGGRIGDFDGDIVVSVSATNQAAWTLLFICSGVAVPDQKVEMTNSISIPYPGPKEFSLLYGIKGIAWFLSDADILKFYADFPEKQPPSEKKTK
jgi:hypothetical protein